MNTDDRERRPMKAEHQASVARLLASVRRRCLTLAALGSIGRAAAAAAVILCAAALIDRGFAPSDVWLLALAAIALVFTAAVWLQSLWPLVRRPDDRRLARLVEERCPELEDRLATAVALAGQRETGLGALLHADAGEAIRRVDVSRIVARGALRGAAWRAAAAGVALGAVLVLGRPTGERAWLVAWLQLFPDAIELIVEPGDARVRAGEPLEIRARLRGAPALLARETPVVLFGRGEAVRRVPMRAVPGTGAPGANDASGHALAVAPVERSFVYSVAAAGVRSRDYTVTALRPPRVARIDLRYEYPAYAGLAPRTEVDGGDIYAPAGTRVRLRVRADRVVARGSLTLRDGRSLSLQASGAGAVGSAEMEGLLVIDRDDSYRVALADADGLASPGETEYFVRVMDDRPPDVRILRPGGDSQATPLEEVLVEARAEDDYRVGRLDLIYAVRGGREQAVPLGAGATAVTGRHLLYLEDLGVKPGDFVSYYARATDVGRAHRARETRSEMFFIEIAPFDQEFSAAQSQAMGGAGSAGGLEALIAAQKDIIGATWNLERRARAGRSEPDIRAVGQAQGELRERTESLAGRLRFATRPPRRPPGAPAGDDPIARAIAAMKSAEDALGRLRTGDAMPHEMAALNELLKAQAEIRRRQVSQQQASAGNEGYGRQGQDLSALFDRELQRQQQTNYESRDNFERRSEEDQESDALAKVRELARRQDELARRQRELANANLDAEELKRQLERLTREQTELREQAERLERELSRSQQAAGQQGRSLRDASDEMRGATSDLRRQDLAGASARGDRAAEKLREVERRIRGANPEERRRAMGELQVDAQQLADAERRVADEAARLGRPETDGGARRRLADEQDRLAGRVGDLEKRLREMASSGAGAERDAAAEASRELARRNLGRQLRESGEALRQEAGGQRPEPGGQRPEAGGRRPEAGGQQPETGQTEREIARSLDRVAERLGTPEDAESRRLADGAARAREARDRLGDLARRVDRLGRESQPPSGRQGQARQGGGSGGGGDAARLREEFARELERARELVEELQRAVPASGLGGSTPERHEYSLSAPAREAFKNDFSAWEQLSRNVALALERQEARLAEKLAGRRRQDRLAAGAADAVPEQYRALVARYFEALARSGGARSSGPAKKP
jgi:hypothetical protein